MPLAKTDLPPLDDGDRVWFAMTDEGRPVDCYVEREILDCLKRGSSEHLLDKFAAYRPVFEVMISDMHLKGLDPVVAVDNVTRWDL